MQQFTKPENALKRADELCAVNQKESALIALHDVLSSKRHRTWQPAIEDVMIRYLDLCVELRKGKAAKDGLIQYRIICQQINVASMETVLRHFMTLSEEATRGALELAEKMIGERVSSLLDFDDLEAEETPESLMLATIGGSGDSKKRTDRQIVTPTLKFLWESFRTVLDILRNNTKLEELYRDAAANAFSFCLKYKRSVEFRRLCEILRNHITSQTKVDPKWKDREPPTPESLQIHLETRFGQLATAIELELWQEAYRTVEDVHLLLQQMKKPPKPSSMASYHSQLTMVFWVADNKVFHAYAVSMLYASNKTLKTPPPQEEMQTNASRAVLAAMSIPLSSPIVDVNLLEYDLEHEKTKRMAQMLSFPAGASRSALLEDLSARGVIATAHPQVRELYALVERPMIPLDLAERCLVLLDQVREVKQLEQYDGPLKRLIALRMLQQMERVYLTIHMEHVKNSIAGLLNWPEIETLIVWAVKRELLTLRIDYKSGRLNHQPNQVDAVASSEVRDSLFKFATAIDAVAEHLRAADIEQRKADVRAELYGSIEAGMEEEHRKILSRRLIIERRKEEAERVIVEEQREKERLRQLAQQQEEKEEKERRDAEARRREREREARERAEEEQAQMRKLAEQMAEQRKAMKVTRKKGDTAKVETDVDKLAEKDRNELMREQRELMMDERTEFEKRLESMGKRHDHLERARREEERPLLEALWEEQQAEDRKAHEEQVAALAQQMKETRAHGLREKQRFHRMSNAAEAFTNRVMSTRREAHVAVVEAWREEQAKRREQARLEREAAEAEERAREAALEAARREAEEEEARKILEAQEAARKKKEEEEERQRVLERQKQKERELEEKQRLAELERQTAKLREREQKGTSWALEEDEEPEAAQPEEAPAASTTADAARSGEKRTDKAAEDDWQSHPMDGRRSLRDRDGPPRDGPPPRGGDRWERDPRRIGDRDEGRPGGFDRDAPDRRSGLERGPPRGLGRDRDAPHRGGFDRDAPPRSGFDRDGPPRGGFDRDGPPRGGFDREGPPRGGFDRDARRAGFDRDAPPRSFDRDPPPRGGFDRDGPPRGGFERDGPPRSGFDRDAPTRDGPARRGGFSDRGPPRDAPRDRGSEGDRTAGSWRR